jgi:hypothetical protein
MNTSYIGSGQRTFRQAIIRLLETDYGFLNSRRIMSMLAEDVEKLADKFHPEAACVRNGWMVFTGTKAVGGKARPGQSAGDYQLVTLSWPVLLPEDIEATIQIPTGKERQPAQTELLKKRLQRIIEHGLEHPDGPVLLTCADLGLMLGQTDSKISYLLQQLRTETGKTLITKGYYFDQGVRPTHKAEIVALYEQGKDEADIARQSNHAQSSVGRYLRDYERVKLLVSHNLTAEQISPIAGLRPSVVGAYVQLVQKYHPNLLSDSGKAPIRA